MKIASMSSLVMCLLRQVVPKAYAPSPKCCNEATQQPLSRAIPFFFGTSEIPLTWHSVLADREQMQKKGLEFKTSKKPKF